MLLIRLLNRFFPGLPTSWSYLYSHKPHGIPTLGRIKFKSTFSFTQYKAEVHAGRTYKSLKYTAIFVCAPLISYVAYKYMWTHDKPFALGKEVLCLNLDPRNVETDTKGAEKVNSNTSVQLEVTGQLLENFESLVMVSVKPSDSVIRPPCDICCVVDVSGSMGSEAKTKNNEGNIESHGLSVLDVVRHAVKTIVMCMEPQDRLSLVTYNHTANTEFELKHMDEVGKAMAMEKLDELMPDSTTNLWAGLDMGLAVLRRKSRKDANCSLFILTDGMPNVIPPRGHIPMLKMYKDRHGLPCNIGTFGFGYDLDSLLLHDIAVEGDGMYAFIPDSSFVGTILVNAISNGLCTLSRNVVLAIETQNGAKIMSEGVDGEVLGGGHVCNLTDWGAQVSLGPLLYGQHRDIVFRIRMPEGKSENPLTATIEYEDCNGKTNKISSILKLDQAISELITVQALRSKFVGLIRKAIVEADSNIVTGRKTVRKLIQKLSSTDVVEDPFVSDLLKDANGQVTEAFSREDWYQNWGKHYLLSLTRAHLLQQCTNFKDPGLQHYGGSLFTKIRDFADETFIKIPPPIPTMEQWIPLVSMARYHDSDAPCFSGDSRVLLNDLTQKLVSEVVKGDVLKTPSSIGKVRCVVKTYCSEGKTVIVSLDGLKITPWHPIRVNGVWKFPCEVVQPKETVCEAVYSFLLENSIENIIIVNGIECATLGHSYTGDVIGHPYFGTERVRHDLARMKGWSNGLVELSDRNCLLRDETTGLVSSLRQ